MSSSLASARAKRAGNPAPPVSGNRPITSINSQAAFAQHNMPQGVGYNMPPPPNNVRVAKSMQPASTSGRQQPPPQQPSYAQQASYAQQSSYAQQPYNDLYSGTSSGSSSINGSSSSTTSRRIPITRISVSDAIGQLSHRLGKVELWIMETEHAESENASGMMSSVPPSATLSANQSIIDSSVLTTIVNRLDSLEKAPAVVAPISNSTELSSKLEEELKSAQEQVARLNDTVTKHTLTLAKHTEELYKFNRDLVETKDLLKSFMLRYDTFVSDTNTAFGDYETALSELEKKVGPTATATANADGNDVALSEDTTTLADIANLADFTDIADLKSVDMTNIDINE